MSPSLLHRVVRPTLDRLGVPRPGETLVVGLSGGADSVALLDVLVELGRARSFRVVAAHLDHGLRPDSSADAAFCRRLCDALGVALVVGQADVRARARRERGGLEDAARRERHAFLRDARRRAGAEWLALAHTRDDQAETLLLHLLRGAGLAGLRAMRPRSGDLLRPLLAASREEVRAHLAARGLDWREDPTNADPTLLRNRVRHELLPLIESRFNPAARAALARSAALLGDDERALAALVDDAYAGVVRDASAREAPGRVLLAGRALAGLPPAVARGVLRRAIDAAGGLAGVAAVHVERLLALARSSARSGRRLALPGRREALWRFDDLVIGPRREPLAPFAFALRVPGRIELPGGEVLVARSDAGPALSNALTAVVPVASDPPLQVRTRRPGDRVQTRGREVSLKRFLLDRRVPVDERDRLPLLAAGTRVLWVPGQTLDPPAAAGPFVRIELEVAA